VFVVQTVPVMARWSAVERGHVGRAGQAEQRGQGGGGEAEGESANEGEGERSSERGEGGAEDNALEDAETEREGEGRETESEDPDGEDELPWVRYARYRRAARLQSALSGRPGQTAF
jgi:hypothetical protein